MHFEAAKKEILAVLEKKKTKKDDDAARSQVDASASGQGGGFHGKFAATTVDGRVAAGFKLLTTLANLNGALLILLSAPQCPHLFLLMRAPPPQAFVATPQGG